MNEHLLALGCFLAALAIEYGVLKYRDIVFIAGGTVTAFAFATLGVLLLSV